MLKSSKPIVAEICQPEAAPEPTGGKKGGGKKGGGSFASVGDKFVKSLKALMTELNSLQAHFVRCIKSNPEKKPRLLHGESVIDQLKMSGTLDAVRLIQAGYPTRIPYESIHSRYSKVRADRGPIHRLWPPNPALSPRQPPPCSPAKTAPSVFRPPPSSLVCAGARRRARHQRGRALALRVLRGDRRGPDCSRDGTQ